MTATTLDQAPRSRARPRRGSFYLVMALVMATIVVVGFSQTVGDALIRPKVAPPLLIYFHAGLFSAWMTLYVAQSALVRGGSVALHRRLGLIWLCLGAAMPFMGVATAIVMRRFDILHFHAKMNFIVVPLMDMATFTPCFVLAALWRKRPEYHRRLMLLATLMLIGAGLGRLPVPDAWFDFAYFYWVIDALILAAMARDLVVQRRVHPVFVVALPLVIASQVVAWVLWKHPPAAWLAFCHGIVGVG